MITSVLSLSHGFKHLFIVDWVNRFIEKMKCCLGIGGEIVSPSDFLIFVWTHAYSFPSFLRLMVFYFELVAVSMNLGNIVDKVDKEDKLVKNWTRRR